MDENNKIFYDLIFKVAMLRFAIENRVDFFDLIRSTSVEEYNRENTLYKLSEISYKLYKEIAKEWLNGKDKD